MQAQHNLTLKIIVMANSTSPTGNITPNVSFKILYLLNNIDITKQMGLSIVLSIPSN